MPTYLILLIGRLLAIGNLDFRNLRLLLAGRPFTLRADAILPKGHAASDCKPSADWFDILFDAPSLLTEDI